MPGADSEGRERSGSASKRGGRLRDQLDSVCERGILGLVLAILVWSPLAMASVRPIDFVAVQVMTGLALLLWMARFWTQRPFRLFWPPVCWAVYAFVAYALARCRIVDIPFLAWREMMQVVVYGILFLIVANNLNRRESAETITIALVGLGMVLSILAIYQFATHSPVVSWYSWAHRPTQYLRRGSGTFYNPDNFGGYVGMLTPLALAYVIVSRMSAVAKVVLSYGLLMILAGLCVSVSRGAILASGAACALLCLALLAQGTHMLAAVIALVVLCGGALGVKSQMESVTRRFSQNDNTLQGDGRPLYWKVAGDIYHDHQLWGAGPAHFDEETYIYRPAQLRGAIRYAHNEYLNTLADWGVVGLSVIAVTVGLLFFGAWRSWRAVRRFSDMGSKRSDKGAFVLGAAFAIIAAGLHCVVDFDFHIPADALLAIILMALLAAHQRFATEAHWKNPGLFGKMVLTFAALGAVVFLLADSWRVGREQLCLERAKAEQRILDVTVDPDLPNYEELANSPQRKAAFQAQLQDLRQATAIDPTDSQASSLLGDAYWGIATKGDRGYQQNTLDAMRWYSRAIMTNPLDARIWLQYGMCLDWLDRHQQADKYFRKAVDLDSRGWYTAFCMGKHCVELKQWDLARHYFVSAYIGTFGNANIYQYLARLDTWKKEAPTK